MEHTPEWAYTAKLLISKHQQVQLLEAASVLLAMNEAPESSETSSPPESGSSAHSDVVSSTETSPPPQERPESKRFSSNSSVYSQSYQSSVFSNDKSGHYRQWSTDAGTSVMGDYGDEDQADLRRRWDCFLAAMEALLRPYPFLIP